MEDLKNKRSKKNDLIIGVFIAVYANWLISLVDKMGTEINWIFGVFLFSFLPFFWFFREAFKNSDQKRWVKCFRWSTLLGAFYLIMIACVLFFSGLFTSHTPFSILGTAIWALLVQIERQVS